MTPYERVELCMTVDDFTTNYASLLSLKLKVENGEVLEEEDIKKLSSLSAQLSRLLSKIYHLEEMFGYESVGIPIDGTSNFHGFSIQNGELVGDLSYAYQISCPWYCSFYEGERIEISDFFKFFISSFIIHLTDMYWPEIVEQVRTGKKQKKPKRKRGQLFYQFSSLFRKGA